MSWQKGFGGVGCWLSYAQGGPAHLSDINSMDKANEKPDLKDPHIVFTVDLLVGSIVISW